MARVIWGLYTFFKTTTTHPHKQRRLTTDGLLTSGAEAGAERKRSGNGGTYFCVSKSFSSIVIFCVFTSPQALTRSQRQISVPLEEGGRPAVGIHRSSFLPFAGETVNTRGATRRRRMTGS